MQKKPCKSKMRRILYLLLSVVLLLIGCGQTDACPQFENSDEKREKTVSEDFANVPEPSVDDVEADAENKIEGRLISLIRSGKFERCSTSDMEFNSKDTKEMIAQKLHQCEKMSLYIFDEDSLYILKNLSLLPNLRQLSIRANTEGNCRIEDFTFLAGFSRLEDLSIHYDAEEEIDLSFLAEMETMRKLTLWDCRIRDGTFLEKMPQLESLTLYDTTVDDLAFLEKMPELANLTFCGDGTVKNPEAVGKLSGLQELDLWECGLTDISFLGGLTKLRSLDLSNNAISDLTPLAGMTKLEQFRAERNQIRELSPLAGLSNLYDLSLTGNEITDISALEGLSCLNQVDLINNRITDLSPLAGKEELIKLNVYGNPYADLRPFWNVPALVYGGGEVTEAEVETVGNWMKEQHPEIEEYECIDYVEGDLNQDGRTDIAFVTNEIRRPSRQLFVLLKQKDGGWQEIAALPLAAISGRSGIEPFEAVFMGDGYLMSDDGCLDIYFYQDGKLEPVKKVWVEGSLPGAWHVTIEDMEKDTCLKYDVVSDGQRMVRTDMRYE